MSTQSGVASIARMKADEFRRRIGDGLDAVIAGLRQHADQAAEAIFGISAA